MARIGLVTDSNAQLPPELARRYGVEVVPLTVMIDGVAHAEGVDLTADEFYARFESGTPDLSTSQPGPGLFAAAYERLAARRVTEILSVHVSEDISGTLNSARLAQATSPVPVRLVDSGTASFGVSCCLWEAAESIRAGAGLVEAAAVAEQTAETVGNVFVVQALELAGRGGRINLDVDEAEGIPVVSATGADIEVVGLAGDLDEAARIMTDFTLGWGEGLRVAVGIADPAAAPMVEAMTNGLESHARVKDLVHYRVGPSVGVHTGPGTAGAFFYPAR
jgi:DegV family protein with EDD domain